MVQEINTKQEFDTIIAGDKVVFIDFYANWCGPCRMISPDFEKLAEEHAENEGVEFYKVNIDNLQDVAEAAGIQSIPAFYAYKNNAHIDKLIGANRNGLTALINTHTPAL